MFRKRVAWLTAAYCLVTASVLTGLLLKLRQDAIVSGENLVGAFAQLTEEQTNRTIQSAEQILQGATATLAAANAAGSANTDSIRTQFLELIRDRPFITAIWVIDENGRVIHNTLLDDMIGRVVSDRRYFIDRRARPDSTFDLGVPVRGKIAGNWFIPATRALRHANGEFAGIIVAAVDPLYFDKVWTLDDRVADVTMALFRRDGILLMRSPFAADAMGASFVGSPTFASLQTGRKAGTYENVSVVDGQTRIFAYRQLAVYPNLVLIVGQSMDRILAGWMRIAWIVAIGWAIAAASVGFLALWLVHEWDKRHASEDRYQLLFDASPYPKLVADAATRRILAANDEAAAQYGWSRAELIGMDANDLYPPEDVPLVTAQRPQDATGEARILHGLHHRTKDGTIIDVEINMRRITYEGRPALLSMVQNVTARNRAEAARRTVEAQLRQAQKMEAVGQLTGGIAHDFNNILMVILANSDAVLEEENLPPGVATPLEEIADAVLRASTLTHQLLAFSRNQPLQPQRTDINALVRATSKLLRRTLGATITVNMALADDLWAVEIDRAQLDTTLVNLCINARDAMPEGGRLLIETDNAMLDDEYIAENPEVVAGAYAMLAVTDTGAGMSREVLEKVFEPFFTTKAVGKGTGLGLSMVYGFIKQSKGHIRIYSEVGQGTSIKLYLPRSDGASEGETARESSTVPRGSERILVVEDDAMVRGSVVRQLRSLGYTVSQADEGATGIAAAEAEKKPFDLLLTDVVMPGLVNGKALADEVMRRWPTTKVVFMSGYTENALTQEGRIAPGVLLMSKPFRKNDLARMIRRALDATYASANKELVSG